MTLKFKSEKEFAEWAAKAKPRIKGVEILLPQKVTQRAPEPRRQPRKARCIPEWLRTLGVGVYAAVLFVVLLVWRLARPFVMLSAGFFVLCLIVELLIRIGR